MNREDVDMCEPDDESDLKYKPFSKGSRNTINKAGSCFAKR